MEHRKGVNGLFEFKVLWEGYPDEPTWEPRCALENNLVLNEYLATCVL